MKTTSPLGLVLVCALAVSVWAKDGKKTVLQYGDGAPDGKRSLGGSGEMIRFELPKKGLKVIGVRIHGSRYGMPDSPNESFLIFFMTDDLTEIAHAAMAPYALFNRGEEQWVEALFRESVEVPKEFWVVLDFRAHRTKGVYVSYDTSTGGKHSRIGLPGLPDKEVDFGGDWMIEVMLAQ
ncbi:MAG: hypothetical protein AB1696_01250 [Planctomycetota bacterium]